jgi:hypothetical protein
MKRWIECWLAAAVCSVSSVGCGDASAEQSQLAAGGSAAPVSMTTAGNAPVLAAGTGGQTAPPAAGSGGSAGMVAPPSAAGAGGSAGAAGSGGSAGQAAGSGSAGQAAPSGNERLPCDVADVIKRQCLSCHGNPLNLGAPMMLITYADFQRVAPSDASKRVYQVVGTRVADTQRPMPPRANGKIAAQDLKTLTDWSSQGGPALPTTAANCAD